MKSLFSRLALLGCVVAPLLIEKAWAAPVYRETFQYCPRTPSGSLDAKQLTGWSAVRKNKLVGDGGLLKVSELGSPNTSLKAFNSDPEGQLTGNVLWTKPTTGLTLFTDEFSFDISSITSVSYDQRFDGLNSATVVRDGSRIAFLIGNDWYISDQTFNVAKRSVWETVSVNLAGMTFGTVTVAPGIGPRSPVNSGISLPASGTVTAFGVYVARANDRVRIDNFTLSDSTPDGTYGLGLDGDLSVCPDLSIKATPAPTPKPDTFCSDAQLKSLGSLRVNSKLKKDIVTNLPARTLKGRRDQALLSLILLANPRLDLLTNIIVGDYDRTTQVLRLPSSVRPDGFVGTVSSTVDIKLNRFAARYMENYLRRYAKDGDKTKALFPRVDRGTEKLITTALCSKQFKRLVRLRAGRVGVRIKFNF